MTRTVLLTLAFGLAAILATGTLPVRGGIAAQTPGPVPVATIGQLERAMVGPSSDAIFNVGRAEPSRRRMTNGRPWRTQPSSLPRQPICT